MFKAKITPYTLQFAFTARTSREIMTVKHTLFLEVYDDANPEIKGIGEIAYFPSLQPSFVSEKHFMEDVRRFVENIDDHVRGAALPQNSALRFGFEMAMANLGQGGAFCRFQSPEVIENIATGIRFNGLVWISDADTMLREVHRKIAEGFSCIKLKIGALDFDRELSLISEIRKEYPTAADLEIRVDANGAFTPDNVMDRLERLARYDLHSIEQPLPRDCGATPAVCRNSPVPVALDEDVIERWMDPDGCRQWLETRRPAYIVLKPSLVGGFDATSQWIDAAEKSGVGWWVTSALESSVGLSAIAQSLGRYPRQALAMAHGLGTGRIYTNNPPSNVVTRGQRLYITHPSAPVPGIKTK